MSISVTSPPASRAKDPGADADRPGADDQHAVAFPDRGATDGMGADRLELDHGCVAEAEAAGGIEVLLGHQDALAHAAVDMDAEDFERRAAVRLALAASDAVAAGEIRVDDHRRAGREVRAGRAAGNHTGQLVTHDAGIGEEGVGALEDVEIGAADADRPHVDGDKARCRLGRGPLHPFKPAGLGTDDRSHSNPLVYTVLRWWRSDNA